MPAFAGNHHLKRSVACRTDDASRGWWQAGPANALKRSMDWYRGSSSSHTFTKSSLICCWLSVKGESTFGHLDFASVTSPGEFARIKLRLPDAGTSASSGYQTDNKRGSAICPRCP